MKFHMLMRLFAWFLHSTFVSLEKQINNRCSGNTNQKGMKKLTIVIIALLRTAVIAAFATETTADKGFHQQSFSKIVVENGIDLVLTENNNQSMCIRGYDEAVNKVDWKIKGKILYIKSREGSLKNQGVFNICVNGLQEIRIPGNSEVSTRGQIRLKTAAPYMLLELMEPGGM
jgi:Putative auto-transporter adhesin, head GIN domain